ncbi:putative transcriptional regulator, LysR-family [Corynebacterium glutamicum MB001]|uniref:Transcriptional regulator n=1 Tax=Corynebacterium glutamicum (strain ATCC 13032 / DSM 20300 / JCM 1318 / BCRC 11384 / CCUG 27702 / LMG 3730 / NBRC 12168 / NCIMB 10025 / NRRL B-2784 / 534) TaxID=196627 RepID=Q8NLL4_CORGL|nr:LysR family transcriptional regulator [Corynebacterium glutamicum]AGT06628.1 putative transcriptional regulator, LysR-family [Corynebacterium glutamicum MB001]ARV66330.1 LysR family transcriptional regulator [Corynebacterium glutamicum]ASW15219.1 putative transcriptional regulator, LysR-family [Corynebacterium glutamicum]AUI02622.1 LysR family transcriptional regulator [Corynebacterium glutamicum]AUI03112.1 LysR family transcriptional regulator [Corynebacterium glutamicum]
MGNDGGDLRIDDLRSFISVAQSGHLTETAERLGIPQPTLSRRISRVEKHAGTPLFDRAGRKLVLNQRGHAFLNHASAIVAEFNSAATEIKRLMDPEKGTIRLDFMHSLGTWMVPELIRTFRAEHPNVEFQLHQAAAMLLVDRVLADETDLALVGPKPAEVGTSLGWAPLLRQRLALAVPADHRLASFSGQGELPLITAAEEPFVAMRAGFGTRLLMDALAEEAGFVPNVVFESMELTTVAGLVSAGLGVGVVPMDDPYLPTVGIVQRPLSPPAYRELGLVWRLNAGPAPAVDNFRKFVAGSRYALEEG